MYSLPLTQELMADVLGLSGPHVSRLLRLLREEGLITIDGHRLTVIDLESLTQLAGLEKAYLARNPPILLKGQKLSPEALRDPDTIRKCSVRRRRSMGSWPVRSCRWG